MAVELSKLLQLVVDKKATELKLLVGAPPSVLLNGNLRPLNLPPLTPDDTLRFMRAIAPERSQQEFSEGGVCEFGFDFEKKAHFFVSVFMHGGHCGIKLRNVPKRLHALDDEDMPS